MSYGEGGYGEGLLVEPPAATPSTPDYLLTEAGDLILFEDETEVYTLGVLQVAIWYYDGVTETLTDFNEWYDGALLQPMRIETWWDGAAEQPLATG